MSMLSFKRIAMSAWGSEEDLGGRRFEVRHVDVLVPMLEASDYTKLAAVSTILGNSHIQLVYTDNTGPQAFMVSTEETRKKVLFIYSMLKYLAA